MWAFLCKTLEQGSQVVKLTSVQASGPVISQTLISAFRRFLPISNVNIYHPLILRCILASLCNFSPYILDYLSLKNSNFKKKYLAALRTHR